MEKKMGFNANGIELTNRTYYVVEVAFMSANLPHKAIFYHSHDGLGDLFNYGYESVYSIDLEHFYYLKLIEKIDSMK